MTLKQFRVRDVVISLPAETGQEGGIADCAESPSAPNCWDGETLICLGGYTRHCEKTQIITCWKGGFTIRACGDRPTVCGWFISELPVCEEGSPTVCNERISPYVLIHECNDAITWPECGPASKIPTPYTPVIDGVNTPVILEKIAGAADLPALKQELRHIMEALDKYDVPATPDELDAVEQRLSQALEEVQARRQAAQ